MTAVSHVDFYFDYLSPYAYLAHTQLRRLGATIVYRPFSIRGVMEKVGNVPTSVTCKAKNRYIQADLRRWVTHCGVPFERNPSIMQVDPRRLLRATLWAVRRGPVDDLVTALYEGMWGIPTPLVTPSDVAAVLRRVGIDDPQLETVIDASELDEELEAATTGAAERGVFGAPCMFVGDEMFFGNDRIDFVRAALERAA